MKKKSVLLGALLVLLVSFAQLMAQDKSSARFTYVVTKVVDGDTFVATDGNIHFKVRIAGMDAPERGQAYSKIATYRVSELVLNKRIEIKSVGRGLDRYGRVLGQVFLNGNDVALRLIQEGYATYYRPTCEDYPAAKKKYNYNPLPYIQAEANAQRSRRNMWSEVTIELPCRYRRQKKAQQQR